MTKDGGQGRKKRIKKSQCKERKKYLIPIKWNIKKYQEIMRDILEN